MGRSTWVCMASLNEHAFFFKSRMGVLDLYFYRGVNFGVWMREKKTRELYHCLIMNAANKLLSESRRWFCCTQEDGLFHRDVLMGNGQMSVGGGIFCNWIGRRKVCKNFWVSNSWIWLIWNEKFKEIWISPMYRDLMQNSR